MPVSLLGVLKRLWINSKYEAPNLKQIRITNDINSKRVELLNLEFGNCFAFKISIFGFFIAKISLRITSSFYICHRGLAIS